MPARFLSMARSRTRIQESSLLKMYQRACLKGKRGRPGGRAEARICLPISSACAIVIFRDRYMQTPMSFMDIHGARRDG